MTRKDFNLIAGVLREQVEAAGFNTESRETLVDLTATFAEKLKDTNPNFDKDRFVDAVLGEK